MMNRRMRCVFAASLAMLFGSATHAAAQTLLTVNGASAPANVSVAAGSQITVAVTAGPGGQTDWVGFFPAASADTGYQDWRYLSGTTAPPPSGLSDATIAFLAPAVPGDYQFRLFANDGFTKIAWSGIVTVTPSPTRLTVNGVAPPAPMSAGLGTHVTVGVADGPANATDWVGLFPAGSNDSGYVSWRYLSGTMAPPAAGTPAAAIDFPVPVSAGSYEFRFFASNGFVRLATSTTLTVTAGTAQLTVNGVVPPEAATIAAGSATVVGVSGGPGNATDWVGLYAQGSTDASYLAWRYLSDTAAPPAEGMVVAMIHFIAPVAAGAYELRFFADNGFGRLATSAGITVPASPSRLTVNGVAAPATATITAGSPAVVDVSDGPGNAGDWVGLFAQGSPDTAYLDWRYLSDTMSPPSAGVAAATIHFTAPVAAGGYEFRLFADNGFGRLAPSASITVPASPARITVNGIAPPAPVQVLPGATVSVHVSDGPANGTDWIGLAASGTPDTGYIAWQYLNGLTAPPAAGLAAADLSFTLPAIAGTYEFRLFTNNGFNRLATGPAVVASTSTTTCLTVSPLAIAAAASGASGAIAVSATDSSCGWTASSDSAWLTLTLGGLSGPYPAQVLADNPVGYWRLDDASGASVADASGHGLSGSINDGVTRQPGGALTDGDASMTFDGNTGRVRVAPDAQLSIASGLTMEAWIKTSDAGRSQRIVGKGGAFTQWDMFLTDTGQLLSWLLFNTDAVYEYGYMMGTATLNDGLWHHVVVTWDGATVSQYVDAALDGTTPFAGPLNIDPSAPLFIGIDPFGYQMRGSLDEVAVYDHALTPEQVSAHYALAHVAPVAHGSGTVNYAAEANTTAVSRAAALMIAGQTVTVTQAAHAATPTCSFTLSIGSIAAAWTGGSAPFTVTAPAGCAWTVSGDAAWLTITPASGVGPSSVTYQANLNLRDARTATIVIGDQSIAASQDAAPACAYVASPSAITVPGAGASGALTVATRFGCSAPATSNDPWITIGGSAAAGYAARVMSDTPSGYWRLGEAAGTTAVDSTGHGGDAQYIGSVALGAGGVTGDGDTAASFSGGYAAANHYALIYGGPFTLEAWVKTAAGASGSIISEWDAPAAGFLLDLVNGHPRFRADDGLDAPASFVVETAAAVDDGSWHHVAGVFDPASGEASVYVDGIVQGMAPQNPDVPFVAGSTLIIGARDSGHSGPLRASIDEVAVYGFALTPAQIQAHVAARADPPADPTTFSYAAPYTVAATLFGVARSGDITIGDQLVQVTQLGLACDTSVSPASTTVPGDGGSSGVFVSGVPGCAWIATSNDAWLSLTTLDGYSGGVVADGAAADATGHGFTGTYTGAVTQGLPGATAGGTSIAFVDGNGSVQVPNVQLQDPTEPYSLEAWVRFSDTQFGVIAQHGLYLLQLSGNSVLFRDQGGEGDFWNIAATRPINNGLWHHVVGVSDIANGVAALYIDGVLNRTRSINNGYSGSNTVAIGAYTSSVNIDDVAIYPVALTAAQVTRHFAMRDFATGGSGLVTVTAPQNPTLEPRTGTLTVAGTTVTVSQAGRTCTSVPQTTLTVGWQASSEPVHVDAFAPTCGWTATATDAWVTLTGTPGIGTADVTLVIGENTTWFTRTTTVIVAGVPVVVTQGGAPAPPEAYPTAYTDSSVDTPTLELASLSVDATDPIFGAPQIQWTQIAGTPVTLSGTTTNRLGFLTPQDETDLTFRVTVTNAVGTTSSDVDVHVQGLATRMGLAPEAGGTSTLQVGSTTLRPGYLFGAADTSFSVSMSSTAGASLDVSAPGASYSINMANDDGDNDVTNLFTATGSSISLLPDQADTFRGLLPDHPSALRISGSDSTGADVDLAVPVAAAGYDITGSATLPDNFGNTPLGDTLVLLKGLSTDYRALEFLSPSLTFGFGNVPPDNYTVSVLAPQGVTGTGFVAAKGSPTAKTLTVPLLAPQFSLSIPPGTHFVVFGVGILVGAEFGHDGLFIAQPNAHPCDLNGAPWYLGGGPVEDTPVGYTFRLNGEIVASGGGSFCSTPIHGLTDGLVFSDTIDVSALTQNGYAFLQGTLTGPRPSGGVVWANYVIGGAPLDKALIVRSVKDVQGVKPQGKLFVVAPKQLIGVPPPSRATFNTFGIDVQFAPAKAKIQSVRVTAMGGNFGSEDLTFRQPFASDNGVIRLRNVGFAANGAGNRDPDGGKDDDLRIQVTINALSPDDGTPVTATAYFGKDSNNHRESVVLTPLFLAGAMSGVQRFGPADNSSPDHEEGKGGDSWGTAAANQLIQQFLPIMVFNDLSLEHGGPWSDHTAHTKGLSIDLRYPGPAGEANPLNGAAGDVNAVARQNRWLQAQNGDVAALQEMIVWLKSVRARLDFIFASNLANFVYIGQVHWNLWPITKGTFGNGAPIIDPDTHQPLGAWPGANKVEQHSGHLNHVHIEVKPRSNLPR
jgi:hypothetical protein